MTTKYLSLEKAKLIQPICERLGVEADAWYNEQGHLRYDATYEIEHDCGNTDGWIPTYRSDTLRNLLPTTYELYQRIKPPTEENLSAGDLYATRLNRTVELRGEEYINALADLISLLEANQLLGEEKK